MSFLRQTKLGTDTQTGMERVSGAGAEATFPQAARRWLGLSGLCLNSLQAPKAVQLSCSVS